MRTLFTRVRLVDETMDRMGSLVVEDGRIVEVREDDGRSARVGGSEEVYDGEGRIALLPAFVDLHAHFRDPGFPEKETLETGAAAAAAGGYGTVVCMANTRPVLDTADAAVELRRRAAAAALVDLYPVLALSRGMEGRDVSHLAALDGAACAAAGVRMLSEDGKDLADDALFSAALREAARLGLPVSCHCDAGGGAAAAAKAAGESRAVWSRIEEDAATERALALGAAAGARIHIAHVSTRRAAELVRSAKASAKAAAVTCEATPHHLALTDADGRRMGSESHGRVNPPLRDEEDREALIEALRDGTIDAIATDHAPHTEADKAAGAPGFSGLETAFAVSSTILAVSGILSLSRLSALMSAAPSRILGLADRGRLAPGLRADLVLADLDARWTVEPAAFRSKGKNSPFAGRILQGRILAVMAAGKLRR